MSSLKLMTLCKIKSRYYLFLAHDNTSVYCDLAQSKSNFLHYWTNLDSHQTTLNQSHFILSFIYF